MPRYRFIQGKDIGTVPGFEGRTWRVSVFDYEELLTGKRTPMVQLTQVLVDKREFGLTAAASEWGALVELLDQAIDQSEERPATLQADHRASPQRGRRGRKEPDRAAVQNKPPFPGGRAGGRGAVA